MSAGPRLDDIRVAGRRIASFIHRTPVLTCAALDQIAGARLYFKCENLQKTGSFKIRGATNAILQLSEAEAARGVVTQSSGNHAAAVSRAAAARGIAAHIVMPKNAPAVKCRAVEGYGGVITFCEPTVEARDAGMRRLLEETGGVLVHPYNDRRVIAGQGTAALELLEDVPELDVLLAPVSGGGLLSGNAIAATGVRSSVRVIGCEPANADDAYRSLKSKHIEKNTTTDTMADGLRAQLCDLTFGIIRERVDEIVRVSEQEIVESMRLVWERMKLVIEPSSAVALAPAVARSIKAEGKRVGVLISGGNVELSSLPF